MRKFILQIVFLSIGFSVQANGDSLLNVWHNTSQPDTSRMQALEGLIRSEYLFVQPDSANILAKTLGNFASSVNDKKWQGIAFNIQGISFAIRGQYDSAAFYYDKNLTIQLELDNKEGIASAYNNLGLVHKDLGETEKAIDYFNLSLETYSDLKISRVPAMTLMNLADIYTNRGDHIQAIRYLHQSLKILEVIGNQQDIAHVNINIGKIYAQQEDFDRALLYFEKSAEILEKISDQQALAVVFSNIGLVYQSKKEYAKSMEYYQSAKEIQEGTGDRRGLATTLLNVSEVYIVLENFDSAMIACQNSLDLCEQTGDPYGKASALIRMSMVYNRQQKYKDAIKLSEEALSLVKALNNANGIRNASANLYASYKAIGDFKKALEMYELSVSTWESLKSEENQKATIEQEYKYQYDKQHLSDSLDFIKQREIGDLAHKSELEKEEQQRYGLYGGLVFLTLLGGLAFRGYRRKRKDNAIIAQQKKEVEKQKEVIEETHREIKDSIAYAKRIQNAILPPDRLVKESLKNSFILYKPKDVVAGDFYWLSQVEDNVLYAAADCTGHGVPGAMVSVVCNNALNRAVREYGLTDPGKILDKTREIVTSEFEKSDDEVKDGMDISLCSLNLKTGELNWAGANNPLWIIRKEKDVIDEIKPDLSTDPDSYRDSSKYELIEVKADKQPIGKFSHPVPFTTHSLKLSGGDSIYIFTDGFPDQFGGEKGKKFKASNLKNLILSIQDNSMDQQKLLLDEALETWRGKLEQVDDVCIIGVRI